MSSTTVREVMTRSPSTIESGSSVVDAALQMLNEDVGSLPVVHGEELVGMVTDRDLVLQVVAKNLDPNKVRVAEVCSEDPAVATPNEPLEQALAIMAAEQVRRLPVVEDGRLVGILAQADVARTAEPSSTGRLVEDISQD
jgi:CBS domain-containing protein